MTFDADYLVPCFVDEVLPGDTMTLATRGFCRVFSPLESPIMDNIEVETLFFYCPSRLLWTNWRYFMGEHDDAGAQDTDFTVPVLGTGITVDHGSGTSLGYLAAYFGIPHNLNTTQVSVNSLPFRMYNFVYNEFLRDQNVIDSVTVQTDNGADVTGNYSLLKSAKKHDYFTSALPFIQKGDAQEIPLTDAPVWTDSNAGSVLSIYSTTAGGGSWRQIDTPAGGVADVSGTSSTDAFKMYAELSSGVGLTVTALRQTLAIQRMLEKDGRAGTRLTETIREHFGVTVPDYTLQRPEFLGGGKSYINVSPVANTSAQLAANVPGSDDNYQGDLRGVGTGRVTGGFAKSFVEHGYILGLIRARADVTYFQGLDRMWSRSTRYDFYWPTLAGLSDQSVLNKEIYVSNSSATDDAVFGYAPRWDEYRTKKNELVGMFNPDVSGSLSHWHLAEDFSSLPSLNQTFIESNSPMSRVQSYATADDFIADLYYDYKCARPLPVFSIPSILPRF
jgi:hypothetical protein